MPVRFLSVSIALLLHLLSLLHLFLLQLFHLFHRYLRDRESLTERLIVFVKNPALDEWCDFS